ncbi:hypothetical protein N2152v2_000053 [Parachlorella kessleri]
MATPTLRILLPTQVESLGVPALRPASGSGAAASKGPPAVADTKRAFMENFRRPLPGLYNNVIQELLVQQHLFRWNADYKYSEVEALVICNIFDQVEALGICNIFDQVLDGLPEGEREAVFDAYIRALQQDPGKYRTDASRLEAWAKGLSSPADIKPDPNGDDVQQALARVASAVAGKSFLYTKFFAVGLFRLLELSGAKDPKSLSALVSSLGVPSERVNADLLTYKGVLTKLQGAKDIMKEFIERERKKKAERDAARAAAANDGANSSQPADVQA